MVWTNFSNFGRTLVNSKASVNDSSASPLRPVAHIENPLVRSLTSRSRDGALPKLRRNLLHPCPCPQLPIASRRLERTPFDVTKQGKDTWRYRLVPSHSRSIPMITRTAPATMRRISSSTSGTREKMHRHAGVAECITRPIKV